MIKITKQYLHRSSFYKDSQNTCSGVQGWISLLEQNWSRNCRAGKPSDIFSWYTRTTTRHQECEEKRSSFSPLLTKCLKRKFLQIALFAFPQQRWIVSRAQATHLGVHCIQQSFGNVFSQRFTFDYCLCQSFRRPKGKSLLNGLVFF